MKTNGPILIALALILPLSLAFMQSGQEEIRFKTDARGMGLRDFITWVGEHIEGAITYASPALKVANSREGRVVVEKEVKLSPGEVLPFSQDILSGHGLVLLPLGSPGNPLWLVESLNEPTLLASRTVFVSEEEIEAHRFEHPPVVTMVSLKNVGLETIQAELEKSLGKTAQGKSPLIPVPALNQFIIKASGRNAFHIVKMIRSLDRAPAPGGGGVESSLRERLKRLENRVNKLEALAERSPEKP